MRKTGILLFWTLLWISGHAQALLDTPVSLSLKNATIPEALVELSEQSGVPIAFSRRFFEKAPSISIQVQQQRLSLILEQVLKETDIDFKIRNGSIVLFRKKSRPSTYQLNGYITDAETGEGIIGASIYSPALRIGTHSNEYGFYSLALPQGQTQLIVGYVGTQAQSQTLQLSSDLRKNWELQTNLALDEVLISQESDNPDHHQDHAIGVRTIRTDWLQEAPAVVGEEDLVQHIRMLPGVQSSADGIGGLHVRGGDNSQNLMLLDGVTVYNASHLLGIFSIYNSSAIRSANLMTGAFPARYGGRLSSVLDVRTREGNQKHWGGEAGIGLMSTKGTLEGPILGGKGAILLTGRRTITNRLIAPSVIRAFTDEKPRDYDFGFYDVNAKVNLKLSDSDRLFLSLYQGGDSFSLNTDSLSTGPSGPDRARWKQETSLEWGNRIASLRWNHIFTPKLFSNFTLSYSQYQFRNAEFARRFNGLPAEEMDFSFLNFASEIQDWAARLDLNYYPSPKHTIHIGGGVTRHFLRPDVVYLDEKTDSSRVPQKRERIQDFEPFKGGISFLAYESFLYAEEVFQPSEKWYIHLGSRFSAFQGDRSLYGTVEPRLRLRHTLRPKWYVRAGISRMVQYLHQVSNTGLNLPNDVWVPSSRLVKPQKSWQGEIGLQYVPAEGWLFSVDAYYKEMRDLYQLPDSVELLERPLNSDIRKELFRGSGNSYGMEIMIEKRTGRTGGWLSYGLSKSNRQFFHENFGEAYPYQFDRRHQINLFVFHKLSPSLTLSSTWTYASPAPRLVVYQEDEVVDLSPPNAKNEIRTKPYHHLDISLSYERASSFGTHRFKAGLYNLYNNRNIAFHRLYDVGGRDNALKPIAMLPLLPSLSYAVSF